MHILYVEDNPSDVRIVEELLQFDTEPHTLDAVSTLAEAVAYLGECSPQVALVDLSLPDAHGYAIVNALQNESPTMPLIVVTGRDDEALGIELVRYGAQDYLAKAHLDEHVLFRAIRYAYERKQIELALMQSNEQLMRANLVAAEMEQLKSAFLANMNHEIRTPLTAILGFSRILEEELDGDQRDMAQHISRGGERLMATLESLLTLSQLEAGTLKNERVLVPVYQTIEEAIEPFVDRLHEKSVALYVQCPRNLMINVHPLLFSQCLHHLVSNAVKFTAEGEIVVKAFLNEGIFHLIVTDTGIGIPSDRLATIFQPFEQVSLGLNRLYEGSGLGLAISRKLVEMAGGGIQVASEVGRGSTFSIDVPLKLPSAA
ncbi:MAG: hypothetical protein RhofKO_15930 [Rhodothermales bacterium]